ncbi:MAG TPA: AAA family ATPase [Gemmataceae bacterium]|nr:AAA family ATPase [Gemmataceae bacterium]
MTEALKQGLGSVTIDEVKRELAKRPLIRAVVSGMTTVATPAMKQAETSVVRFARDGRGRYRPLGNPERPCHREPFNEGQKAAVRDVLASRDRVTLIRGPAGTGKTTLEEEIGIALREVGVPVVALAQSNSAVDVLRKEAHFGDAETVARFLKDAKLQAEAMNGLVLVDEASLLGTRDMRSMFELCEKLGARVVLVGDTRQNRAVAAGEPMRLLEERAGLKAAEVTEIVRQGGDYARAAKALSDGKTAEGFAALDGLGWIKEIPDGERYQAMANAYLATIREKKADGKYKTALAVSPTWAEANRITQAIRAELKTQDKPGKNKTGEKILSEERPLNIWVPAHLTEPQKGDDAGWIGPGDLLKFHQNTKNYKNGARVEVTEGMKIPVESAKHFEVYRPAKLDVAVGDRIRYTANGKTRDQKHGLRNGELATVQGFTAKGDLIVDHGWVISKDWGHIAHGYAVTSENSQGRTVEKVFVGLSSQSFGAANERRFYVPATRGREQAVIFTDDKDELLKAVQKPDHPISALELADASHRQSPLRQRLKRHLAFVRRLASFAQTHGGRKRHVQEITPIHQERRYVR